MGSCVITTLQRGQCSYKKVMMSEVKMIGLTMFLLFISLSTSQPVNGTENDTGDTEMAEAITDMAEETTLADDTEYEYEDLLDEDGNVVYEYYYEVTVMTSLPPTPIPGCLPGFLCGGGVSLGATKGNTGSTGGTKTVTIKKRRKRRKKVKKTKKLSCQKTFNKNGKCFFQCGSRWSMC